MLADANMQPMEITVATNQYSFASAGTNLSAFQVVTSQRGLPADKHGDQIARIIVNSAAGASSGTVTFVLTDKHRETRFLQIDAAVTATTDRSDAAGTAGDFLCTVDVGGTGKDKLDLLGANGEKFWMVGVTDAGSLGAIDVYVEPSPAL